MASLKCLSRCDSLEKNSASGPRPGPGRPPKKGRALSLVPIKRVKVTEVETKSALSPTSIKRFCFRREKSKLSLAVKGSQDGGSKGKDANNLDTFCDGEPPPTLEEIRCWGKSFDKLMRSSAGRKVFREFLRCEYSEENILFWLACEELKKEANPDAVEEKARFIYEDYISILSPKEVSLDSRVREIVNKNMVAPTPHTFDEAQLQIYTLMHRDSYPRFINSSTFKSLAQLGNNNGDGTASGGGSGSATPTTTQRKQSNA